MPEQGAVDPVVEATAGEIFRGALNVFWATALDRLRSRYRIGFYEPDAGRRGRARTVSGHVDWGSVAAFPRRRRASSGAIENMVIPKGHQPIGTNSPR